jgi:hypothetical protein
VGSRTPLAGQDAVGQVVDASYSLAYSWSVLLLAHSHPLDFLDQGYGYYGFLLAALASGRRLTGVGRKAVQARDPIDFQEVLVWRCARMPRPEEVYHSRPKMVSRCVACSWSVLRLVHSHPLDFLDGGYGCYGF